MGMEVELPNGKWKNREPQRIPRDFVLKKKVILYVEIRVFNLILSIPENSPN